MKQIILIFGILASGLCSGYSQDEIRLDTVKMRCYYTQFCVMDTLNKKAKISDIMLLDIGNRISKYFPYYRYIRNLLGSEMIAQKKSEQEIADMVLKQPKTSRVMDMTIYKGFPENKITLIDLFAFDKYKYEEEMVVPKWKLKNDTLTVCGYLCKKANTRFRGRDYEAWYAPQIPVKEGPWKFNGLPGLILKIEDREKEFSFLCTAIEIPDKITPIEISGSHKNHKKIDKSAYNKAKQAVMDNQGAFLQGNPLVPAGPIPPHNFIKKPYNPIELSE